MIRREKIAIPGILGCSAQRPVFMGFATADVLHSISFADILDQDTGRGYQRRFNSQHSLDFRKYIQLDNSSTIPLTFNLRPRKDGAWAIKKQKPPNVLLEISADAGKVLTQVDCQHRLGFLSDLAIILPFMCFIGLSEREEMEIFSVINSKAKGLSTSLLDFHDATLSKDLGGERPELFIALHLNNNVDSPWFRQLDLGGNSTSGLMRRASLRTMQKGIKKFLKQTRILSKHELEVTTQFVLDYWISISELLRGPWENPRRHLINKGVGVYALMCIAGDIYEEIAADEKFGDRKLIISKLSEFITDINWSSSGPLGGLGGEVGVKAALSIIRDLRKKKNLRIVSRG